MKPAMTNLSPQPRIEEAILDDCEGVFTQSASPTMTMRGPAQRSKLRPLGIIGPGAIVRTHLRTGGLILSYTLPFQRCRLDAAALDLHAGGDGVGEDVQLLDTDAGGADASVNHAGLGDALRQGFRQAHMALADDAADTVGDRLVIHHAAEFIGADHPAALRRLVLDRKVDVDTHALGTAVLIRVYADGGVQHHVMQEDVTQALRVRAQ